MKYRWDKKYLYWGITAFLVIVACMLAFAIVFRFDVVGNILGTVAKVLSPVFYGVVIAFLIDPIVRFTERMMARIFKKKRKELQSNPGKLKKAQRRGRAISIVIALIFVFALLTGLLMLVIPQIIDSLSMMIDNFSGYYRNFTKWINQFLSNDSTVGNLVKDVLGDGFEKVNEFIQKNIMPQAQKYLGDITSGIFGFIWTLKDILMGFIIAIYFTNDS